MIHPEKAAFIGKIGHRRTRSIVTASVLIALLVRICLMQAGDGRSTAVRFAWSPPDLADPTVLALGNGSTYNLLDDGKDYVIQLPDRVKIGSTMIEGGRNIVIIGGHISVPAGGTTDAERRGLYIKNATGTVHIEGLLIDGSNEDGFDGISISAPQAIVQIVNVRVEGIRGTFEGFHGDVVQPFGGVRTLRIDHLTAISNYQGLYLTETQGRIGSADLRNINLSYDSNSIDATTYLLWLPVDPHTCETYPVSLENVYVTPRPGQDAAGFAVWPNDKVPRGCPNNDAAGEISWPSLAPVQGHVTEGSPRWGDFVTSSSVGVGYAPGPQHWPPQHVANDTTVKAIPVFRRQEELTRNLRKNQPKVIGVWY